MKRATLLLTLLSCYALFGDGLNTDTQLNDIPGTATLGEMVTAGLGEDGCVSTNEFQEATNRIELAKRDRTSLAVVRKAKDIWTWTNYVSNEWSSVDAPADFLETANSPGAMPLYFESGMGAMGGWFGANQYWPNGRVKYDQGYNFSGELGALSTNLVFAFTARSEDGHELYRFCARAHRESATDERLVSWDGDTTDVPVTVNQFVRIATTDFVERSVSNAVTSATNGLRHVDGTARQLPKYLWSLSFSDSYEGDAYWYYDFEDSQIDGHRHPGQCSARRIGNVLERNYDWYRDESAEFVVSMDSGPGRFASVGVANIGENLTEELVSSGAYSRFYKCLPGRTVDGVNSQGVAIEVNVVVTNGSRWEVERGVDGRDMDSRWAVRWVLDNASSAEWAASNLAQRVYVSKSMLNKGYSVHYAIVDKDETWLVEDGVARLQDVGEPFVMTNFRLDTSAESIYANDPYGAGYERYFMLKDGSVNVTNAWYSNGYRRNADGDFPWPSEFAGCVDDYGPITNTETNRLQAWAKTNIPPEVPDRVFPRGAKLWQTVHTSVYDISNLVLRVAVQEQDDWYVFMVPQSSGLQEDDVRKIAARAVMDTLGGALGILDYLEGDGASYIDTGITYDNSYEIEADITVQNDDEQSCVFGSYTTKAPESMRFLTYNQVYSEIYLNRVNMYVGQNIPVFEEENPFPRGVRVKIVVPSGTNRKITISYSGKDGLVHEVKSKIGTATAQCLRPFVLFASRSFNSGTGSASITAHTKARIHRFRVSKDGSAVLDLVPRIRKDLGVTEPAMYDLVNKLWYMNSGKGRLIAGPDLSGEDEFDIIYGSAFSNPASKEYVNSQISDQISTSNPAFSNAVLSVQVDTNALAHVGEMYALFEGLPVDPTTGGVSVVALLAALAAAVTWLKKNTITSGKKDDGSPEDPKLADFFTGSNGVLTETIDDRLPIPISAKSEGFTTESYKRFVVTVSGDMNVTLHTPNGDDAEIFECRFNGSSLAADASITFAGATATTMDTDCGTVTAGKVALMSAFWNGTTWDVNWKVEG